MNFIIEICFFFNDTATTEIYTLSLHDALPFFRRFFNLPQRQQPEERETQSTGSGVIVDAANGYVLTNGHVVENATRIEVTTKDNRRYTAKLIGRDPDTDVAVLQIPSSGVVAVPMGDSDRLQVGDFVLAIGNPFGL